MKRALPFIAFAAAALGPATADVAPPSHFESAVTVADAPLNEDLFSPFEAGPDAVKLTAVYRGYFGPLTLGTITLTATFDGDKYEVTSFLKTEGLVDVFASNDLRTQTLGRIENGVRAPEIYRSQLFKKDDPNQLVELVYNETGARLWSQPAYNLERYPVTADDIKGSADPMSSLLLIGIAGGMDTPPCEGVTRVFDGKRRYNLNLSDNGVTTLKARSKKDYGGETYKCAALYEQVAGFKSQKTAEDYASLWLADIPEFSLRAPVKISYPTDFGSVVLKAKLLKVTSADEKVLLAGKCEPDADVCRSGKR
ncbi:MAG: DUF3108 domain-containing protein [Pseudomonadota bacterium]